MADVAKKYQEKLPSIKKDVKRWMDFYKENFERFYEFRKFVFKSSISDAAREVLRATGKPELEFNICEAYISRLRGEFSKQEPSISVRSADGAQNADTRVPGTVEGYLRAMFSDANSDGFEYDVYTDILSGGFSVAKVYTDYAHEMSMEQNIYIKRVFDPTLCGFDTMSKTSHKGDGRFCFELYPKTKEEVQDLYGEDVTRDIKFTRDFSGFSWSYNNNDDQDIVLICDFWEKKKKKTRIVKLSNGKTITKQMYEEHLLKWETAGMVSQPPKIVQERITDIETICRYRLIENKILEYIETDYKMLPLVFGHGNTINIREGVNGKMQEMTRPYIYHAKGVQTLKNFSGQCLANELENMIQHKISASVESIPKGGEEAYINPQKSSILLYNQFKDNNPNIPLSPPTIIARTPIPPEITNTLSLSDQMTQAILGSFDMDMGKLPSNSLSGIAIVETATLGNAAAMPSIVGVMNMLNRIAEVIVDLIPKYYITPRTIPIMGSDGKRSYQDINSKQGVSMGYHSNVLEVKVEAGVNFQIQKSKAMQQLIALMQASPLFEQFMNAKGLPALLDNIDIRGIDQIKQDAEQWAAQIQQQQQMQQQMQQQQMQQQMQQGAQPNPSILKAQIDQQKLQLDQKKLQLDAQQKQAANQLKIIELQQSQQELNNDKLRIAAEMKENHDDAMLEKAKLMDESIRSHMEIDLDKHDQIHKHAMDIANHGLLLDKHLSSIHSHS